MNRGVDTMILGEYIANISGGGMEIFDNRVFLVWSVDCDVFSVL
jgi:hypothetical protein